MPFPAAILLALVLDFLLGDPRWLPHPVRLIGSLCADYEALTRRGPLPERSSGLLAVLLVLATTLAGATVLLALLAWLSPWLGLTASVFLLYSSMAIRDLIGHARAVHQGLVDPRLSEDQRLEAGRDRVQMLVGRDTARLDEAGIVRACVESVAENLVDSVCAPLFWALAGGLLLPMDPAAGAALGALGYRAVNTMDSMYGYKNTRYRDFGLIAARLDDAANFLPARLSGLVVVLAARLLGLEARASWRILRRDRLRHASPNSGHTEAAVAGALGIQLGGPATYFGHLVDKPCLGDARRPVETDDVLRASRLVLASALLFAVAVMAVPLLFA